MLHEEIICAGFGGQGIMFMGKLLAYAGMKEGMEVTWMPSYGAEVRGGTAHCMVVISQERIASPIVLNPTSCVVLNKPSLAKFENRMKKGGLLVVNTSLIETELKREDINVISVPISCIATQLGDVRVANMVALGVLIARNKIISLEILINSLSQVLPPHRHNLIDINKSALRKGANLC